MSTPPLPLDPLARAYAERAGDLCARRTWRWWQGLYYAVLIAALVAFLCWRWDLFIIFFTCCSAAFYLALILFRLAAMLLSLLGPGPRRASAVELHGYDPSHLPVYTILVPLYREKAVAAKIIHRLSLLDYPADRLQILLLLEGDDAETQGALAGLTLPPAFEIVLVPPGQPRTKPRACNHGLARTRGEFVVIYDAEDRPEPDQLRQALQAFHQAPERVACIQAKLNYYNPRQNLLTRLFTMEYTAWFDLYLPGLQRLGVPIPLGGTSNHFRTSVLRELGGWDPFNVTEDCDLGLRLHRQGYRTQVVDSTTWEEANSQMGNWLRQRSRWVKGFMQTHLVHYRHPWRTLRALGPWGMLSCYLTVGGVATMLVLNLVFWALGGVYLGLLALDALSGRSPWLVIAGQREEFRLAWKMIYSGPYEDPMWAAQSVVFFGISVSLLLANGIFILINALACLRRGYRDLLPVALLSPVYWVMMSLAACRGLWQLLTKPFYWEKTLHGLDGASEESPPPKVAP